MYDYENSNKPKHEDGDSSFKNSLNDHKPKSVSKYDNEEDVLNLGVDNYTDLMDQLHPLREAELVDIFPALKLFMKSEEEEGGGRQTMIGKKIQLDMEKKNSDRMTMARKSMK